MPKLTKRIVDNSVPRAADYCVWCSELKGFGCRVLKSGRRSYVADYRTATGARRRMVLGPHGVLTTEEARQKAAAVLNGALSGSDPLGERSARREAVTVADLCREYLDAAERGLILGKGGRAKKASTLATDRGRVARHIVPLLARKIVAELTMADLNRFVRDVTAGKTAAIEKTKLRGKAVVEGGAGTAARTMGLLGGILSFAVAEGIIASNPARGVRRPADGCRTRRLTGAEYGTLGAALAAAEREGMAWQALAGIRLLALTGARLSEVAELCWCEVDMARQALRLDDSKTGASTRPLGTPAVTLLTALPSREGGTYVLPALRGAAHYGGLRNALRRVTASAGLDDVSAHTLRHSFASMAGDLDMAEATIGAVLGHRAATVTGRYIHRLDLTLVAAADRIADAVADAMAGKT